MRDLNSISFTTKKLVSGNLQVKFQIQNASRPSYGYLLVNQAFSDEDIMEEIKLRLNLREKSKMDLLKFTFKNQWKDDHQFYLYSA
ncbi:hypothetical protein [Cyclobacterium qasimii]|uniref:Uncharacterized protein n=2 Tax=Cyclobacterium qasimii TaxID=1350429 RepID=S7VGE5_9BACT|nr:hypothetical protein [Cyclobacterium qasimii]EPR69270.1 hypothetical protein ADICYQ_1770 [Cyclobacterium qasimii M12-11B]GEO20950.1 hypothetical protein CQA01_14840 [Cyclobacterium qasimii]